jgi:ABC-type polysaccharide/polyol phosphate transport system ATPase subunit
MTAAVEIQKVSKHFKLYKEKYTTLKERVLHAGSVPYTEFWALRDIVADVGQGETVGMLGRNGSGKSTLLKCIAGILQPSSGQIVVRGSLAAMLELGAGMQPELTGRDNIFLNGSLLGMSRREMARRFDEIVAFAELEDFIDNQVKYYSSGMYMRLGFAVAVNVDPDILLIDEVLAVGDERFQQKCMERVKMFQQEGRTIVFVSHSADLMRQICDRVIVLEHGDVVTIAKPPEAIGKFRKILLESEISVSGEELSALSSDLQVSTRRKAKITGCELLIPNDLSRDHVLPGDSLELRIGIDVAERLPQVSIMLSVFGATGGLLFGVSTEALGQLYDLVPGHCTVVLRIESLPILDGAYTVDIAVQDAGYGLVHDNAEGIAKFQVVNPGRFGGLISVAVDASLEPAGSVSGVRF